MPLKTAKKQMHKKQALYKNMTAKTEAAKLKTRQVHQQLLKTEPRKTIQIIAADELSETYMKTPQKMWNKALEKNLLLTAEDSKPDIKIILISSDHTKIVSKIKTETKTHNTNLDYAELCTAALNWAGLNVEGKDTLNLDTQTYKKFGGTNKNSIWLNINKQATPKQVQWALARICHPFWR